MSTWQKTSTRVKLSALSLGVALLALALLPALASADPRATALPSLRRLPPHPAQSSPLSGSGTVAKKLPSPVNSAQRWPE